MEPPLCHPRLRPRIGTDTTAMYKSINGPLRHGRGLHPLPCTVSFLAKAIKLLRAVDAHSAAAKKPLDLWRGLKNLSTSDTFEKDGGTEIAPMSTYPKSGARTQTRRCTPQAAAHALGPHAGTGRATGKSRFATPSARTR